MIRSILDDFLILSSRQILKKLGAGVLPIPNACELSSGCREIREGPVA
jgi:hypothetical protein